MKWSLGTDVCFRGVANWCNQGESNGTGSCSGSKEGAVAHENMSVVKIVPVTVLSVESHGIYNKTSLWTTHWEQDFLITYAYLMIHSSHATCEVPVIWTLPLPECQTQWHTLPIWLSYSPSPHSGEVHWWSRPSIALWYASCSDLPPSLPIVVVVCSPLR